MTDWTDTNAAESHLRVNGKIVGKVIRGYDWAPDGTKRWNCWQCMIHTPRLRLVGFRKRRDAAKAFVETAREGWLARKAKLAAWARSGIRGAK